VNAIIAGYDVASGREFPHVKEIAIPERANLSRSHGYRGKRRAALHWRELDLKSFPVAINMHDGSNIARLKGTIRQWFSKNGEVVFSDHGVGLIIRAESRSQDDGILFRKFRSFR
jgi:hypothetical protein